MRTPDKPRFSITNASLSTFLLASALVWYLCAFKFIQNIAGQDSLLPIAVNFLAFAFTAFVATKITRLTIERGKTIKLWLIIGILISAILPVVLWNTQTIAIMALVVGAYFGLGLPTFTGYFTANTQTKSRAKFGGLAVLLVILSYAAIVSIAGDSALLITGCLATLLAIGLALIVRFSPKEKRNDPRNDVSYHAVITNRTFYLYIIPWLMLSLINDLTMQINASYFTTLNLSNYLIIENLLAGVSAVICGFLADSKGRKRLALIGFILLGVGYATLGLFSSDIYGAWFYLTVDGIAGGIFLALFLITIWGDIAQERNGEKYYFLGLLPYLLSTFAGATIGSYVAGVIPDGTIFSFAAFFLFAATLPLFYAPETLPDKVMKDRDLKSYIENAKKKAQKEAEKAHQKKKEASEKSDTSQDDLNYEEAKKLAEKYY